MRRLGIPAALVCLLASACSKSGPTSVGGEVALRIDADTTETIAFPRGTTLPLDSTAGNDGLLVGHCVLGSQSTEIELERTADGGVSPNGFVWFQLHVDTPDQPHVGHVMAEYDGELYEGDCDVATLDRDRDDGMLEVWVESCAIMTPSPASTGVSVVTVDTMLSFDGCSDR